MEQTSVKRHYAEHLGEFYSWMTGDLSAKCSAFRKFLTENRVFPFSNRIAVDLGAGHGIQSIPLAELGFEVIAVDFTQQLLNELRSNAKDLDITIINDDIRKAGTYARGAELIVCCGDTLSHLDSKAEVRTFIAGITTALSDKGSVILSFRDYSRELKGTDRFIPVRSDDTRILTCILEYEEEHVHVTDLFYELAGGLWQQRVSTYKKVRLIPDEIIGYLEETGLTVYYNQHVNGFVTVIAGL